MTAVPEYPRGWYYLGISSKIGDQPAALQVAGRRVVVFRTESGKIGAMHSRCSHFGSDLSQGRVIGESIQCPFHGWRYGRDGKCVHIPSQKDIPEFACQESFHVTERHRQLFFFPAAEPDYPLPFFDSADSSDYVCSNPLTYFADAPWYMVAANGFDTGHLHLMHGRAVDGEPVFSPKSDVHYQVRCGLKIVGQRWNDRIISKLFGPKAFTAGDIWSGNLIMFDVAYGWMRHRYMISIQPTRPGALRADIFVFARKPPRFFMRWFWMPLEVRIKKMMLAAFYGHEAKSFNGLRYEREHAVSADRHIMKFIEWLEQLPQGG